MKHWFPNGHTTLDYDDVYPFITRGAEAMKIGLILKMIAMPFARRPLLLPFDCLGEKKSWLKEAPMQHYTSRSEPILQQRWSGFTVVDRYQNMMPGFFNLNEFWSHFDRVQ